MRIIKSILILTLIMAFTLNAQDKLDEMPKIKGGMGELAKNIKYPEAAKKEGIMGKVLVKAVIDENGNVTETEVVKSVDIDLDKAAVAAVKMTKFVPGVKDGNNVKSEVTIPIKFKLDGKKKEG